MAFEPGKTPEGAKPWPKGQSANPSGRPKGSLNRSTIAKKVLQMKSVLPDEVLDKLRTIYPGIKNKMSVEEVATIVLMNNVISKGDTAAYKAVMDSAYGAPKQEIDMDAKIDNTTLMIGYGQQDAKD